MLKRRSPVFVSGASVIHAKGTIMGERVKARILVLSDNPYGEGHKMLTALSYEFGKISICAKGAKSAKSPFLASCQLFCYSDAELSAGKNGIYTLCEALLIHSFYDLREDLDTMFLACDMARETLMMAREDDPDPELLRLILNSLYFISTGKRDLALARAVFDVRLLSDQGFFEFPSSVKKEGTRDALVHITSKDLKELYAFGVDETVRSELIDVAAFAVKRFEQNVF